MKATKALLGGLAGASLLTLVHETTRQFVPEAPRMDLLGEQALSRMLAKAHQPVPKEDTLYALTMAGDVVSNALYYSLAGIGDAKTAPLKGTLLGLAAGIGAITLPGPLGLSEAPSKRTTETAIMTIALYTLGGLAAGIAMRLLGRKKRLAPREELVM
jgi:hypothetical protein